MPPTEPHRPPSGVLVVDDSSLMRRAIREVLESDERFRVVGEAADGVEALAFCEDTLPDAILLDIEMPNMDGIEFLRRLRADHHMPVIVISSVGQLGSRRALEALDLGADDVIQKPSGALSVDFTSTAGVSLLDALATVLDLDPA